MKLKRIVYSNLILFSFLAILELPVFGTSVSLLVCQNDKTQNEIRYMSNVFEENLMDYLFDCGHIVTDGKTVIYGNSDTDYQMALDDAMNGYFEYFFYCTLQYSDKPSTNSSGLLLQDIECANWKLLRISDNKVVNTGKAIPVIKDGEKAEAGLLKFSKQIAMAVNKSLTSSSF